jgi:hypothetical protein
MLPDREYELLTAYVDGELSMRQRKAVQRLIRKSPEARALLRRLRADADTIRHLPRRKLGADFPLQVLATIADRRLQPGATPAPTRRAGWPVWAGWAAAAAILLAVSAAAYVSFPLLHKKDKPGEAVVQKPKPATPERQPHDKRDASAHDQPVDVVKRPQPSDLRDSRKDDSHPPDRKPPTDNRKPPRKDVPRPGPHDWLASGGNPKLPPITVPNLSLFLPLRELGQKQNQEKLRAKFHKDDAVHVQLLCRDTGKALNELRGVLKNRGIQLIVEQKARARLKDRRVPTVYVVYAENLKPEELTVILRQLGQVDQRVAVRNKAPEQIGDVMIAGLSPKFREYFTKILGAPPSPPPANKNPRGSGLRKSEVGDPEDGPVQRAQGKDANQPGAAKPAEKVERAALVLAYHEDNSDVNPQVSRSKDVKQFRAGRQPRIPGTLQVVFMLSRASA